MEITEIKFRRFPAQGRLRALVSVTFDGVFAVHDIKVIAGGVIPPNADLTFTVELINIER